MYPVWGSGWGMTIMYSAWFLKTLLNFFLYPKTCYIHKSEDNEINSVISVPHIDLKNVFWNTLWTKYILKVLSLFLNEKCYCSVYSFHPFTRIHCDWCSAVFKSQIYLQVAMISTTGDIQYKFSWENVLNNFPWWVIEGENLSQDKNVSCACGNCHFLCDLIDSSCTPFMSSFYWHFDVLHAIELVWFCIKQREHAKRIKESVLK